MSVLENPYSVQDTNRNLRFQGLTTGSAWETHLQDPPLSPLVLIHRDNFLLFLHSYFIGTNGRGLSAGAKNAASAKTPVGTNVTSEITSLLS